MGILVSFSADQVQKLEKMSSMVISEHSSEEFTSVDDAERVKSVIEEPSLNHISE